MPKFGKTILLMPLLVGLSLPMLAAGYRSVSVDQRGQLHIVLDSGRAVLAPKVRGQVAFGDAVIADDRQTIGWLAMYPDEAIRYYKGAQYGGGLVIYRGGRILHNFPSEQMFWGWEFQDGGKRVAYSTGPSHGGAAECVLREVGSGRVVARWQVREGSEVPEWARSLRR